MAQYYVEVVVLGVSTIEHLLKSLLDARTQAHDMCEIEKTISFDRKSDGGDE